MKPARLIPAERVAPLGQRFCASVSDAKLGKITVRPAPARPVPRPAQLAKLAGRLVAPSYRGSHGRVNPWADHLARSSGGWSSKLPFGSVARQRKPVVQQKPIYKSRGPHQLQLAPARQKTPAGRPYKGAAASMAGSFLPKAGWLGSTVQACAGRRKPLVSAKAERWTLAKAQPVQEPAPQRPQRRQLFESHQAARAAKAMCAVKSLLAELPAEMADRALGEEAVRQVPSARRRRELAIALLRKKAGPKGDRAKKALRSWRLLQGVAKRRNLPAGGLPASAALVADIVRGELQRAQREAKGSQGGNTVGGTIRDGFLWLQSVAQLPIEAAGLLVEAAAEPEEGETPNPVRHAGSMAIAVQCAFEAVSSEAKWSVRRTLARSFLCSALIHNIRMNDALNCELFPDEKDPAGGVRGRTRVRSKRSLPLQLYAPAEGYLGPFEWLGEHLAEIKGWKYCLPAFESAKAGCPSTATRLLPGVLPDTQVLTAFRDILEHSSFKFPGSPKEFYDEWALRGHSPHSTGSDMARFAGQRAGFNETDAREFGHWLRDKNAPQADPRRVPGAPTRGQPDGKPCSRGSMSLRYSQGQKRRGEREAQLDVRARMISLVRVALELWGKPWWKLPPGTDDWEILREAWELEVPHGV